MQEKIVKITDADPATDFSTVIFGKRFYGQKLLPNKPGKCLTTLWSSQEFSPIRYFGTYEVDIVARNSQNQKPFSRLFGPKSKTIHAIKVADDLKLKQWTSLMYRWIPAVAGLLIVIVGGLVVLLYFN